MSIKQTNKNYIKNLLLKTVLKKGKHTTAKNVIVNSSLNLSKNIKNFYELFENMVKNSMFPFKIVQNKKKYEYKYIKTNKSISNFISRIVNSSRNKNKRISFDFYFKNEINKILENENNINSMKKNVQSSLNNINFIPLTGKKNFNEKDIELITSKKTEMKKIYRNFNIYFYYVSNVIYSTNIKKSIKIEYDCSILQNEVKSLNFI